MALTPFQRTLCRLLEDPGFSPGSILDHAARSARYSQEEIAVLAFSGPAPNAQALARSWHAMLDEARMIVSMLPAEHAGTCVSSASGALWRGDATQLGQALASDELRFRTGSIRGALPQVRGT